jgi:hypothetical protein
VWPRIIGSGFVRESRVSEVKDSYDLVVFVNSTVSIVLSLDQRKITERRSLSSFTCGISWARGRLTYK